MDEDKDLKTGEEETPTGEDQPGKEQAPEPEETKEKSEEEPEEEVKISKSELKELRKKANDGENYKKAVISNNRKSRTLPGLEPEKKPAKKEVDEYGDEIPTKEKYITEAEMDIRDQKRAISRACEDDEVALNWNEIVEFYTPPAVKGYDNTLAAINKAYKLFQTERSANEKPGKTEEQKIADKATKDLASDKGVSKGKEKTKKPVRKTILNRTKGMNDWY